MSWTKAHGLPALRRPKLCVKKIKVPREPDEGNVAGTVGNEAYRASLWGPKRPQSPTEK